MDREPGRIGFMSTQRRETGSSPATRICRRGARYRRQRTTCKKSDGENGPIGLSSIARHRRAEACAGTAPPKNLARLATNSLLSDLRIAWLVRFVRLVQIFLLGTHFGSPPLAAGSGTANCTPAPHELSFPPIPSPSGFATFHLTLPQIPAGKRRWAEGYDGQRDLHLQHAA
jgi:hypothetical protein